MTSANAPVWTPTSSTQGGVGILDGYDFAKHAAIALLMAQGRRLALLHQTSAVHETPAWPRLARRHCYTAGARESHRTPRLCKWKSGDGWTPGSIRGRSYGLQDMKVHLLDSGAPDQVPRFVLKDLPTGTPAQHRCSKPPGLTMSDHFDEVALQCARAARLRQWMEVNDSDETLSCHLTSSFRAVSTYLDLNCLALGRNTAPSLPLLLPAFVHLRRHRGSSTTSTAP